MSFKLLRFYRFVSYFGDKYSDYFSFRCKIVEESLGDAEFLDFFKKKGSLLHGWCGRLLLEIGWWGRRVLLDCNLAGYGLSSDFDHHHIGASAEVATWSGDEATVEVEEVDGGEVAVG